jgi:hypothetical protein
MINIKTATYIAAVVAAVGASSHQFITRARKDSRVVEIETTIVNSASPALAFNLAQDLISERMLSGHYDDKSDAEARQDFQSLFTFYTNA